MTKKRLFNAFILCMALASISFVSCKEKKQSTTTSKKDSEPVVFKTATVPELTDFSYTLTDSGEGVLITKYLGTSDSVRIPSEIEGLPVVALGSELFVKSRKTLITCVIPDSVTEIEGGLFSNCKELTNVKLSKNIDSISPGMFGRCEALRTLIIPDGVKTIENEAFAFSGIEELVLPDSITEIKNSAFYSCTCLQSIKLPTSLKVIHPQVFENCEILSSLVFPEGLEEIGSNVFTNCYGLSNVQFPSTLKKIGDNSFSCRYNEYLGKSNSISTLEFPSEMEEFNVTFEYLAHLKSVRLPNTLEEISNSLFNDGTPLCKDTLEEINFPVSLKTIDSHAFTNFSKLNNIIIPDSITSLEFKDYMDYYGENTLICNAFKGTSLNLATQKRLKELGYKGEF